MCKVRYNTLLWQLSGNRISGLCELYRTAYGLLLSTRILL